MGIVSVGTNRWVSIHQALLPIVDVLGTPGLDYKDINYTGADYCSPGCAFERVTISAGMHVTASASFAKGSKDRPVSLHRQPMYELQLNYARTMNIVLFDAKDRRGWLVDGINAMLYIALCQLNTRPFTESNYFEMANFRYADPINGLESAYQVLKDERNADLALAEQIEKTVETTISNDDKTKETTKLTKKYFYFRDLVQQIWHILEQIQEHQTHLLSTPGIGLRGTDRDKLEGFGFKDIVMGNNPLRPRVVTLQSSGRGWVDFTRKAHAITLIGKGFGELIQPAPEANRLCSHWTRVPQGQDYLVACISQLKQICEMGGDLNSDPLTLQQGIYWHKGAKLFEPCSGCKVGRAGASCDRVQVLLPPSLGHKTHPHPFQQLNGAVVFGRSAKFNWDWGQVGGPVKATPGAPVEDREEGFEDSGIGTSILASTRDATSRSEVSSESRPPLADSAVAIRGLVPAAGPAMDSTGERTEHADVPDNAKPTSSRVYVAHPPTRGFRKKTATVIKKLFHRY
jgi:hypothetical protein